MSRLRLSTPIPDELSPDRSTCEHCGGSISWDDLGYTHDTTGFGECGVQIEGATPPRSRSSGVEIALFVLNPEIKLTPGTDTSAEPVEWYVDA